MKKIASTSNPDLEVIDDYKSRWTLASNRRHGWHNLHKIARYTTSFRAARVMTLKKRIDRQIVDLDAVKHFTALPSFSAMIVVQGQDILYERYAPDFGPEHPHSIQSVTKTLVNLIVGQLVERGTLDLSRKIAHYIEDIGSGYAEATLRQALNMDVSNEYSEDFADRHSWYYRHEEAMGWRLPRDIQHEDTQKGLIARITSSDITNRTGLMQYKNANSDLLGWVAERASGRPLRAFLADIVDAAGLEYSLYMTTDREGFPALNGGACLTARDLARYFSLFAREGFGVDGRRVGSAAFIRQTLLGGVRVPPPYEQTLYSNHMMVFGRSLGHTGWGGQFAIANLDTGTVCVFLSVLENAHGFDREYNAAVIRMLTAIGARTGNYSG